MHREEDTGACSITLPRFARSALPCNVLLIVLIIALAMGVGALVWMRMFRVDQIKKKILETVKLPVNAGAPSMLHAMPSSTPSKRAVRRGMTSRHG
jgi:hypothetical protein